MNFLDDNNIAYAVTVLTAAGEIDVAGRDAWALQHLIFAGEHGVTPIECPAPRWSAYVFNLRELGFDIETQREEHGGRYSGSHGRYTLHTKCFVVARSDDFA